MTALQVFIATTDGPSEVQRLTPEDADLQSVICLNGKAQPLPISAAYDAFVRKPTGVVERLVGHPVFRADVARPITDGASWQLGLLLAHALHHQGRLCGRGGQAAALVWITGEVDSDLDVHPVEGIEAKIRSSRALFLDAKAAGKPVHVIVPNDNAAIAAAALQALGADADGVTLAAVGRFAEVAQQFGLERPSSPPRHFRRAVAVALALLLLGAVALVFWVRAPEIALAPPDLKFALLLPSRYGGCPDQAGLAALDRQAVVPTGDRLAIDRSRVCGLRVSAEGAVLAVGADGAVFQAGEAVDIPVARLAAGAAPTLWIAAARVPDDRQTDAAAWVEQAAKSGQFSPQARDGLARSGGGSSLLGLTVDPADVPSPKRYKFN